MSDEKDCIDDNVVGSRISVKTDQCGNSVNNTHSDGSYREHHQDGLNDVCRDFLRNVCRRGNGCRFRHPEPTEAEELGKKMEPIFCHDFQNRECRRPNCRFLHCTKQEEEIYRSSGKLPHHIYDKLTTNKSSELVNKNSTELNKDYIKNDSRRSTNRGKFRRISQVEYEMEQKVSNNHNCRTSNHRNFISSNVINRSYDVVLPPEPKRRAFDTAIGFTSPFSITTERATPLSLNTINTGSITNEFDFAAKANSTLGPAAQTGALATHQTLYNNTRLLEDENAALRRRVEELKKQVADLIATNEFLLEQNAQLRINKSGPTTAPPQPAPAPAPPPPPPPPLGPPLPPISTELLAQQRPGELPVVSAALAASLSASLSAQGGIPVSSMPPLSTSVISTSSTPLVSYPIMTAAIQTLRPPTIPHSLSH